MFEQLNNIIRDGTFFDGVWHKIDVVCCSDWKCGSLMEGLNGVTSRYFCRYCLCTKDELKRLRGSYFPQNAFKSSICLSFYIPIAFICLTDFTEWPISRNYNAHINMMNDTANNKGCIRQPLLQVDASCCPPDVLHMKKGIVTKLVNQLVNWAVVQNREHLLLAEIKKHKIHFR